VSPGSRIQLDLSVDADQKTELLFSVEHPDTQNEESLEAAQSEQPEEVSQ
jgi:hypothetical protein